MPAPRIRPSSPPVAKASTTQSDNGFGLNTTNPKESATGSVLKNEKAILERNTKNKKIHAHNRINLFIKPVTPKIQSGCASNPYKAKNGYTLSSTPFLMLTTP